MTGLIESSLVHQDASSTTLKNKNFYKVGQEGQDTH